ncbi:MAG: peptidase M17, partial [Leptospiraceae bacterium]|nr:peptidase M17 [Leptospiraceae bacterium]
MKLEDLRLDIKVGKNRAENFYVVRHIFKEEIPKELKSLSESKIFSAELGQQYVDSSKQIIYIGLGEKEKLTIHKIASIYLKLGEQVSKWNGIGLQIELEEELTQRINFNTLVYQLANSLYIGSFPVNVLSKSYKEKRKEIKPGNITFSISQEVKESTSLVTMSLNKAKIVSKYLNNARLVAHLPANHFTPEEFVSRSKEIAKQNKLKITVFDEKRLEKEGFGGILSVCKGSDKSPKMILLEYHPQNPATKEKIVLVGKGLT